MSIRILRPLGDFSTMNTTQRSRPSLGIALVASVKATVATATALFLTSIPSASASVFNLPHFTPPGHFGIGLEPELTFGDNSNAGFNLRYTHGLNELNNLNAFFGTGGDARQFRIGGAYTFDFFPDVPNQPGIGLALQGLFVKRFDVGTIELTLIPYLHKTLSSNQQVFEPFLAVPIGLTLAEGRYQYISTLSIGSLFHHNEHFSSVIELGVKLNNVDTYISGGVIYYN